MKWLSKLEKKIARSFWFLPPDIHERQRFISSLVPKRQSILDVGGEQRILAKKLKAAKYVTLNVESTADHFSHHQPSKDDLTYDGTNIPFVDNKFDWTICIDVIEHVPADRRNNLIKEMLRVSKKGLIMSAPLGTKLHRQAEKKMMTYLEKRGHQVEFLEEHIEKGLPRPEEIDQWTREHSAQVSYSGNIHYSNWLLAVQVSELRHPVLNRFWLWFKLGLFLFLNLFFYHLLVGRADFKQSTNRFYLKFMRS